MNSIRKNILIEFIETLTNEKVSANKLKPELVEQLKALLKGFGYTGKKDENNIKIFINQRKRKQEKVLKKKREEELVTY
jgi:hypothetical protein